MLLSDKTDAQYAAQDSSNQSLSSMSLNIKGMTCAGCVMIIEKTLLQVPGVHTAEVNLEKGTAIVKYDDTQITESNILQAKVQDNFKLSLPTEQPQQAIQ